MTKIQLVKADVTELKPGHKYIIALNQEQTTKEDATNLSHLLTEMGIYDSVVMMFRGDPSTGLKVIEQKDADTHS